MMFSKEKFKSIKIMENVLSILKENDFCSNVQIKTSIRLKKFNNIVVQIETNFLHTSLKFRYLLVEPGYDDSISSRFQGKAKIIKELENKNPSEVTEDEMNLLLLKYIEL